MLLLEVFLSFCTTPVKTVLFTKIKGFWSGSAVTAHLSVEVFGLWSKCCDASPEGAISPELLLTQCQAPSGLAWPLRGTFSLKCYFFFLDPTPAWLSAVASGFLFCWFLSWFVWLFPPSPLGVLLWHNYRMVAFLQQVVLLLSLGCEWLTAVHWLALCGCCHGQLVWKSWVSGVFFSDSLVWPTE